MTFKNIVLGQFERGLNEHFLYYLKSDQYLKTNTENVTDF